MSVRSGPHPPYLCSSFVVTMTSKNWYMIMGNLFKIYFYRKLPLGKFLVQYFISIAEFRGMESLEELNFHQVLFLFISLVLPCPLTLG
jgi:hypothetical protein